MPLKDMEQRRAYDRVRNKNPKRQEFHKQYRNSPTRKIYMQEFHKKDYELNREKYIERAKNNYLKNKEKSLEYHKIYYLKNKKKIKAQHKIYNTVHKKELNNSKLNYNTKFENKMKKILRSRLYFVLKQKNITKSDKTLTMLGCTQEYFKKYIEKQFKSGMTIENYGTVWHMDHRIPCSWFNLFDPEQQKRCFHWSNLQPKFSSENISKGNRFAEPSLHHYLGEAK